MGTPVFVVSNEALQSKVKSDGQANVGGVVSSIVINCTHVAILPHTSSACHVLVNVFGQIPVVTSVYVTVTVPQSSVAVASPVLLGSVDPEQSIV
jgi:hypothetical protein